MLYVSEIAVRQGKTPVSRERRCFAIISYKDLEGKKGSQYHQQCANRKIDKHKG